MIYISNKWIRTYCYVSYVARYGLVSYIDSIYKLYLYTLIDHTYWEGVKVKVCAIQGHILLKNIAKCNHITYRDRGFLNDVIKTYGARMKILV